MTRKVEHTKGSGSYFVQTWNGNRWKTLVVTHSLAAARGTALELVRDGTFEETRVTKIFDSYGIPSENDENDEE